MGGKGFLGEEIKYLDNVIPKRNARGLSKCEYQQSPRAKSKSEIKVPLIREGDKVWFGTVEPIARERIILRYVLLN